MFLLKGHTNEIGDSALTYSPDGRLLFSGAMDETARVWDLSTRETVLLLEGHTNLVSGAGFLGDGTVLVTGGWDGLVCFWSLADGKQLHRVELDAGYNCLSVAPDRQTFAAAGSVGFPDEQIDLWDAGTRASTRHLLGHEDQVGTLAHSPDGRYLASGAADNTTRLWDRSTGEQVALMRRRSWIQGLAFSADSRTLAVATGRSVSLHDIPSGRKRASLDRHSKKVLAVAYTPDGRWLLSGGEDCIVNIWDAASNILQRAHRWKIGTIHALTVAPDGMTAAAGGDADILVWDLDD